MQNRIQNPTNQIFRVYQDEIKRTRSSLFNHIGSSSLLLQNASEQILEGKISESKSPLWGEIYPWFISDLTQVEISSTRKVTDGWLAIYLHTIFIDKYLDKKIEIKPEELLASSLLAKEGLLNLHKIVVGTRFEKVFDEALSSSASFEMSDVVNRMNSDIETKEAIAIGKNRVILACAGALAALNEDKGDKIIEFTKSILLTLQLLDDIRDIEEDYLDGNLSYVLAQGFGHSLDQVLGLSKNELLEKLIESGALERTLSKILFSIDDCFNVLSSMGVEYSKDTEAYKYFHRLRHEVKTFHDFMTKTGGAYGHMNPSEKKSFVEGVTKMIYRCDISS